jgi:hypothetical protein
MMNSMPGFFQAQCDSCIDLVTEYIKIGNEMVEARQSLKDARQSKTRATVLGRLQVGLRRRKALRTRLKHHRDSHNLSQSRE